MMLLRLALLVAAVAVPALATSARADNASASQISAAGHGRQPILTNRPSREIFRRNAAGRPYGVRSRHHRRF